MIFVYKKWEMFCDALGKKNRYSVTAKEVLNAKVTNPYLVLKHDVETDVQKAYKIALIEKQHGHRGTYYAQAYLLNDIKNVKLLKEMQAMGHEISYHYDVMDSNKGDIDAAHLEFEHHKSTFEKNGFIVETVCQHGNPVVERKGYTSNRDFFRNEKIRKLYSNISDIMVDFPEKAKTEYSYFSDAGRKFKKIYDPFMNDVINSDDKNIVYDEIEDLLDAIMPNENCMISIHPHRWTDSAFTYVLKSAIFKGIKMLAKKMMKVPIFKRIMSRYYYLAKKI